MGKGAPDVCPPQKKIGCGLFVIKLDNTNFFIAIYIIYMYILILRSLYGDLFHWEIPWTLLEPYKTPGQQQKMCTPSHIKS